MYTILLYSNLLSFIIWCSSSKMVILFWLLSWFWLCFLPWCAVVQCNTPFYYCSILNLIFIFLIITIKISQNSHIIPIKILSCNVKVYGFDIVFSALLRYREIYGDLIISQRFSVPSDSVDWPVNVWNMKLGTVLTYTLSLCLTHTHTHTHTLCLSLCPYLFSLQ